MDKLEQFSGAFVQSLVRNNKQIKEARAIAIFKSAKKHYRRQIEDLQENIDTMETEQESMLDMSPANTQSLILASDFKAEEFYNTDLRLALNIREAKIKLEEALKRHNYLFGAFVKGEAAEVTETVS